MSLLKRCFWMSSNAHFEKILGNRSYPCSSADATPPLPPPPPPLASSPLFSYTSSWCSGNPRSGWAPPTSGDGGQQRTPRGQARHHPLPPRPPGRVHVGMCGGQSLFRRARPPLAVEVALGSNSGIPPFQVVPLAVKNHPWSTSCHIYTLGDLESRGLGVAIPHAARVVALRRCGLWGHGGRIFLFLGVPSLGM